MRLQDLLEEKREALTNKWLERTRSAYPVETAKFLERDSEQFTNPVGFTLTEAVTEIVDVLLAGMDPERVCPPLEKIIRIRAIQDFTPSKAVAFVFLLKGVVRDLLPTTAEGPSLETDLLAFDRQVDQLALFAFDIYCSCREQVFDLRVNELKRNVSTLLRKADMGD